MINIILAFDDNDTGNEERSGLDYFYEACAQNIMAYLNPNDYNLKVIHGGDLNYENVTTTISAFNNESFIFLAYSHGSESALLYYNQTNEYINQENISKFVNSFIYTWSCSTGVKLGPELIINGCLCFIGYDRPIYAGTGSMAFFAEAANCGFFHFLDGHTAKECYYLMKDKYTYFIDVFENDPFMAKLFRNNRDALVLLPFENSGITIASFIQ